MDTKERVENTIRRAGQGVKDGGVEIGMGRRM